MSQNINIDILNVVNVRGNYSEFHLAEKCYVRKLNLLLYNKTIMPLLFVIKYMHKYDIDSYRVINLRIDISIYYIFIIFQDFKALTFSVFCKIIQILHNPHIFSSIYTKTVR